MTVAPAAPTAIAVGVYINGTLCWYGAGAISRLGGAWPDASADLKLGAGIDNEPGLIGQVSEFRLWNEVKTAAQIMTGIGWSSSSPATNAVIVWPLDAAPPAPVTVSGASFGPGVPALMFRSVRSLSASWDALGPGYTYNVAITSADNAYYPAISRATASCAITPFAINTLYTVSVAGVEGGAIGTASSASVITIDLWQPTLTLAPGTGTLALNWSSVDQALSYAVTVTASGGAPQTTAPATMPFDLSPQAFGTQAWTYAVNAVSGNIIGPATPVPDAPAAPGLALSYSQDAAPPGVLLATRYQLRFRAWRICWPSPAAARPAPMRRRCWRRERRAIPSRSRPAARPIAPRRGRFRQAPSAR